MPAGCRINLQRELAGRRWQQRQPAAAAAEAAGGLSRQRVCAAAARLTGWCVAGGAGEGTAVCYLWQQWVRVDEALWALPGQTCNLFVCVRAGQMMQLLLLVHRQQVSEHVSVCWLLICRVPLELHHTMVQGSRTFRCSLLFKHGAHGNSGSSPSQEQEQQLVTVTVQEVGRRWALLVCLLPFLCSSLTPGGGLQLHATSSILTTTCVLCPCSCVHLPVCQDSLQHVHQLVQLLQAVEGQQPQPLAAGSYSFGSEAASAVPVAAPAAAATDSSPPGSDLQPPAPPLANESTPQQQQLVADAASSAMDAAETAAADGSTSGPTATAAAAASAGSADASTGEQGSSTPAVAPEVLFAAISSSKSFSEGFTFAHAAAADALSAAERQVFQLPHLCCLWQKLPVYAASKQRQYVQGVYGLQEDLTDDAAVLQTELLPEVQQEVQVRTASSQVARHGPSLTLPHCKCM